MSARPNPYVVGQWVRGDRFYGRTAELVAILQGGAACLWFVGLRRVGKTSLLKQAEHLAERGTGLVPVFWDLQGAVDADELALSLRDGVLDAADRLAARDVAAESLPPDPPTAIAVLADRLAARGERLLLLCDEVEELLELDRRDENAFGRLWPALMGTPGLRVALASSPRFEAAAADRPLAPLPAPRYLGSLTGDELTAFITQRQLAEPARPAVDVDAVAAITHLTGGHPFLTQLLCRRFAESGDIQRVFSQLVQERTLAHLVEVDLTLLAPLEQRLLRLVAATDLPTISSLASQLSVTPDELAPALDHLEALGALAQSGHVYAPGNQLLSHVLSRRT